MKLTLIAEGSTKWQRLIWRWGVSFLLDDDVVFDTFGRAGILGRNINKFRIDTRRVKQVILSHDDWDHISGLWPLLDGRKDITVYICPGFKQEIKDRIASFGVKLVEAGAMTMVKEGIYSTGELHGESKGKIKYEQSVVIRTANGLALVCGCAHPGAVNIVRHTKEIFHEEVRSLIGGFHLKDNTDEMNMCVIRNLRELGVRRIAPMHCTGKRSAEMMQEAFGPGFVRIKEGDSTEL
jgi:7,8-dihydropterin-6-yl-methyl-4-(beta-D-ribofuranosyl)aminobenzene 5'-phosphate synthase